MGWKRNVVEMAVRGAASLAPAAAQLPDRPRSILVLRNNDIGDLIVVTPLFEALRRRYPEARIAAGIGDWNRAVLANNPFVDDILPVNAPWHNKAVTPQSPLAAARYLLRSPEVAQLRAANFDLGIDVLGSPWGSLLLMRAGVPWRLGVRGYAGGHSGVQQYIDFDPRVQVGTAALRFAALLGGAVVANTPRIYLTADEQHRAELRWKASQPAGLSRRVVIGPGGGLVEKCWPAVRYAALTQHLAADPSLQVTLVGGSNETALGALVAGGANVQNLAGQTTLRELFALVSRADLVICNSSMLMHAAVAFGKPAIVLLGEAMPPAAEHAALWGTPGLTEVCGRHASDGPIVSVAEALAVVSATLRRCDHVISGSGVAAHV
jgi:heptosyltransferase-2